MMKQDMREKVADEIMRDDEGNQYILDVIRNSFQMRWLDHRCVLENWNTAKYFPEDGKNEGTLKSEFLQEINSWFRADSIDSPEAVEGYSGIENIFLLYINVLSDSVVIDFYRLFAPLPAQGFIIQRNNEMTYGYWIDKHCTNSKYKVEQGMIAVTLNESAKADDNKSDPENGYFQITNVALGVAVSSVELED